MTKENEKENKSALPEHLEELLKIAELYQDRQGRRNYKIEDIPTSAPTLAPESLPKS